MQDAIRAKARRLRNLHRKVSNTLACVAHVGAPFTYRCDCMSACSATAACTWDTAGQAPARTITSTRMQGMHGNHRLRIAGMRCRAKGA